MRKRMGVRVALKIYIKIAFQREKQKQKNVL
jgi:hypothetical protein